MHAALTSSTDCRYAKPPLNFPYRLSPKVGKHSWSLQWKRRIGATADRIAWLRPRRTIARVNLAIALLMYQITASTVFASSARAQTATRSETVDRFAKFIDSASVRFAVPASWIRTVMRVESGGDEHAISSRGAMGLMQLMPATWAELSVRYELGLDPFDPRDNILAGTAYLKDMHDRFGSVGFIAAYHAGPARYEQHLVTGKPLPSETTAYVAAVTQLLDNEQGEHAAVDGRRALPWQEAPLFVERAGAP
jgi:soluble lytic murein transglycosylase-like protein